MKLSPLSAVTPLDGRYADKTEHLRDVFSEFALIRYRVIVEVQWFLHLANMEPILEFKGLSKQCQDELNSLIENFSLQDAEKIKKIESITNHDVKAVEYLLKEFIESITDQRDTVEFIHFCCTSEDINNISYALLLKDARKNIIIPELRGITSSLLNLAEAQAATPMLSRTHGQPASPTTLGKEIANVAYRLSAQISRINSISLLAKMNGAVGNYNAHIATYPEVDWENETDKFIKELGLSTNPHTTQIEPHDYMAELFDSLARANIILIDFCQDIWTYISLGYFTQKIVADEIGSSTMPHKINPIDFENAEGNLGLANSIFKHLSSKLPISRMQRDLSDSTVLRNIGVGFGYSTIAFQSVIKGLSKLETDISRLSADLDANWEVLAEPIQMVMRRHGISKPYEKLKLLTRGRKVDKTGVREFIDDLNLPEDTKNSIKQLAPDNYLGSAESQTIKIIKQIKTNDTHN
ncbi:MAG: adenylosuccinate lyase [Cellvibrionales bacterium TMED49]|nr:MAG: adenylosuccinate lyase [Cellvibrionales bacterium TMED49]